MGDTLQFDRNANIGKFKWASLYKQKLTVCIRIQVILLGMVGRSLARALLSAQPNQTKKLTGISRITILYWFSIRISGLSIGITYYIRPFLNKTTVQEPFMVIKVVSSLYNKKSHITSGFAIVRCLWCVSFYTTVIRTRVSYTRKFVIDGLTLMKMVPHCGPRFNVPV
jgi:hypothetical protein